jgi:hypothetical protein
MTSRVVAITIRPGLAAAVLAVLASPAIADPAAETPDMAAFAQLESPTASS